MSSLKDNTRATITTVMLTALATAIFTGCTSGTPSTSGTPDVPNVPSSSVSSLVSSTPEDVPNSSGDDGDSIKFKYWYENNKQDEASSADGTATGENLFNSEKLPVYQDKDGNKYVGSDFNHISVTEDGNISQKDAALLRDEDDFKIYLTDANLVLKEGFTMPSFADLQAADLAEGTATLEDANAQKAILYVNGILVGEIENPSMIDVSDIFSIAANVGNVTFKDNTAVVSFGTAVDVITATFTPQDDNSLAVTYGTTGEKIAVPSQAASYNFSSSTAENNYLRLDLEYIEKTLGYHIIESTTVEGVLELNVITDTKDEFKQGNAIDPKDAASHITNVDIPVTPDGTSTSSADGNTSNSSKPESSESKPTESKPAVSSSTAPASKPTESKPTQSTPTQSSSTPIIKPTGAKYYDKNGNPLPDDFNPDNGGCYDSQGIYYMTPEEQEQELRDIEQKNKEIKDGTFDSVRDTSKEDADELLGLLGL